MTRKDYDALAGIIRTSNALAQSDLFDGNRVIESHGGVDSRSPWPNAQPKTSGATVVRERPRRGANGVTAVKPSTTHRLGVVAKRILSKPEHTNAQTNCSDDNKSAQQCSIITASNAHVVAQMSSIFSRSITSMEAVGHTAGKSRRAKGKPPAVISSTCGSSRTISHRDSRSCVGIANTASISTEIDAPALTSLLRWQIRLLAEGIASYAEEENPRFQRERFILACGFAPSAVEVVDGVVVRS